MSTLQCLDGVQMGYIRFKLSKELDGIAEQVCMKLGMKKSELARVALIEYLKSLSLLSQQVKKGL